MFRCASFTDRIAIVASVLLLLTTLTSQQELSFAELLVHQQNIQLEQQVIQGQLQDLALRHQSAKDARNKDRVNLLEGVRDKLLARMQELQEDLQRLLHRSSSNQKPTRLPQTQTTQRQTNQPPPPSVQPQEEIFHIPDDFQQHEEQPSEDFQQKIEEIALPQPTEQEQLQTKEPAVHNSSFKVTNSTDELFLANVSSNSTTTVIPTVRIRVLKGDRRDRQRKQLHQPQFFDPSSFLGVLPPHQSFRQPPHTFGFAPHDGSFTSFGQPFQSFGQVVQSFVPGVSPQSFSKVIESFGHNKRFSGQGTQTVDQALVTFIRVPQTFNPGTQSFLPRPHSSSQAPVPDDVRQLLIPHSTGPHSVTPQTLLSHSFQFLEQSPQTSSLKPQSFGQESQPFGQKQPAPSQPSVSRDQGQQQFSHDFESSGQTLQPFGQLPQSLGQSPNLSSQAQRPEGQEQELLPQNFGQSSPQTLGQVPPPLLQGAIHFFEPFSSIESFDVEQQPVELQVFTAPPPCRTVDGAPGECRPLVQCLTFYLEITTLSKSRCPLEVGADGSQRLGVCCSFKGQAEVPVGPPLDRRDQGVLLPPPPPRVVIPPFTQQQLSNAANNALKKLQERIQATAFIFSQGVFIPPVHLAPSPVGTHQERFFALTPGGTTAIKAEEGQKNVEASVSLVEEFNLTPDQGTFALPTFSILSTIIGDSCPRRPQCPSFDSGLQFTKYRTADGSCNNLRNGEWGSASVALQRILPPKYGDGVNSPRVADGVPAAEANRDGGSDGLTGARTVSSQFAAASSPNVHSSHEHTLILMQWGQFLDHDLTHTPISRGNNGGISCCQNGEALRRSSNLHHPDCYPIIIAGDDPFFRQFRERCMEFVRSLPAPRPQCNFGPREQMNQVTGYIDASNVYGSSASSQRGLRELSGGRLRVQPSNPSKDVRQQIKRDKGLLPGNRNECTDDADEKECFIAGDTRANEQPQLALMHTLWVREHNRVAGALASLHPNWSDEQLFQEARRIVAAEMQHITYNEFLPIILGKEYMDKFQLTPLVTRGGRHTNLYDADLNAGITNVFATAAFRFGHSLVQGNIQSFTKFGAVKHSLQLSKNQFSPFSLYEEGAVDDFVRGLSTQTCQRLDRFFSRELTDHLFQGDLPFGLDLVALNVQRGRDHGLAPYADWREVCGFKKPTRWEDLLEVMERETVEVLRGIYSSVSEIDLFIGGIGERGGLGGSSSLLGPTFTCLVGDQFARLRRGDRFFYEEGNQPSSFTERQLDQLRKTSLARILCDNSDDVAVMQPLAFFKATFLNQRVPCDSGAIPQVDLRAWAQETPAVA